MKKLILTATALGLAGTLVACGQKVAAVAEAPTPAASAPQAATPNMTMTAGEKTATGVGTVTAMDAANGTITLDHQPIPEANWPAMTMTFKAPPALINAAKVGENVEFEVILRGGAGEVIAMRKR